MEILWKLRSYIRMFARHYVIAFIGLQVVALLNLVPPWLIGRIVDAISEDRLTGTLLATHLGAILAAGFGMYGLRYVWHSQLYGASVGITQVIRQQLFWHFTRLTPEFYTRHSGGDLMAHATNDLNAVEQAAGGGVMTMVDSLIAGLTVIFGMAFVVSGELTLAALLPFPLLVYVTHKYGTNLQRRFGRAQGAFSSLNEEVRESVSAIRAVRSHGLNQRQQSRFDDTLDHTLETNISVAKIDSLFGPTIQLIYGSSFVISLGYGAWLISTGDITVGLFTSFTLYLAQLLGPFLQFGWQFNIFQRGTTSWRRLERLFAQQPMVKEGEAELPADATLDMAVDIEHFTYPAATQHALKQVAFSVPAGGFVGITGPTGGGKSTLISLLLQQYSLPESSRITLANMPINKLTFHALRSKIAWVPQKPFLFSGTVAENIALARPNASEAEIVHAADMAGILDEIHALPDGFKTVLNENGGNLSGGQKQRLTLARALLSDNDILLLDDPFSALDMKTEAKIRKNIKHYFSHKTIVMISQRLANLMTADHIVVMENGSIHEQGTHNELMTNESWYARVFTKQNQANGRQQQVQPQVSTLVSAVNEKVINKAVNKVSEEMGEQYA